MNQEQQTSPLKAIKAYCRNICCLVGEGNDGAMEAWKNCDIKECQLHPFRMGTNEFRKKREVTPEQKSALVKRMEKARMAKS